MTNLEFMWRGNTEGPRANTTNRIDTSLGGLAHIINNVLFKCLFITKTRENSLGAEVNLRNMPPVGLISAGSNDKHGD